MALKTRNLASHAAIGVVVAALIIGGIFASGIWPPTAKPRTGTLLVLLTDAPEELLELNITIDSFSVHIVGEGWREISVDLEQPFNLLELQDGVTMTLAEESTMPVGNYTKIRLSIGSANATFKDIEGVQEIIVPPGHIDVITHFEIADAETTILLVDVEPEVEWVRISESYCLRPVIKASVVGEPPQEPPAQ